MIKGILCKVSALRSQISFYQFTMEKSKSSLRNIKRTKEIAQLYMVCDVFPKKNNFQPLVIARPNIPILRKKAVESGIFFHYKYMFNTNKIWKRNEKL